MLWQRIFDFALLKMKISIVSTYIVALQKLIALEKKSPLPSLAEQFSYLSDVITKA